MDKKKPSLEIPSEPSSLQLRLFAPGMSDMHRAGLGGLACSLHYIEKQYRANTLSDEQIPGFPWDNGQPPWRVESDQITLEFGKPESAAEFLKRLFELSFQIIAKQGAIYLPGQYTQAPSISVLAVTQSALTLTFLQHNKSRGLSASSRTLQIDAEGDGSKLIDIEFRECDWYKHQAAWSALVDGGSITKKPIKYSGTINPGAIVRHDKFKKSTIEDPVERMLPLYFSIVGTLALPINRGVGVLIIPEVVDLKTFQILRPLMSPRNARDCKIAGASDAALQCQLRLRASKEMSLSRIPSCTAVLFRSTAWASQQKSRVDAIQIPRGIEKSLRVFEQAIKQLPPRVITTVAPKDKAKAKKTKAIKKKPVGIAADAIAKAPEHFWSDSIVRPMVADNLALGQPWYRGFHDLMTKLDPVSKEPKRLKLSFEKAGLKNMIDNVEWNDQGEKVIVQAVHQAIKQRLGKIAIENKGKQEVMRKRMKGEFDKWRLAFSGSKTPDQFRQSLCDLFGRAGSNPVLKENWTSILPWLSSPIKWQLARDLSLLALVSYTGTGAKEIEIADDAEEPTDPM